jgi:hypothetical protein
MANLDLRPLSLGEILDNSFALYRRNFVLFFGIAAIPQLLVLALNLAQTFLGISTRFPGTPGAATLQAAGPLTMVTSAVVGILTIIVTVIAYLLTQGATVSAVADIYLGRPTTIGESLRKVRNELGTLFGVGFLNGLVTMVAFIFLIIPGVYMMCRLLTAIPAAVLENLGARDSLERSFALTKGSAGRAFLILLLYFILLFAAMALFASPAAIGLAAAGTDPAMMRLWTAITQISTSVGAVLVTPFLLIATSVFYFDLRVRKEAFDLQMMMNPNTPVGPATGGVPGVLS